MIEINLPPIHNTRSPEQWEIITEHVDINMKSILDIGCGYGDILARCYAAGATTCAGIDENCGIVVQTQARFRDADIKASVDCVAISNIDSVVGRHYDIIICFAVLPYISNRLPTLQWMASHSSTSLIEVQYENDGPGKLFGIRDDDDMKKILGLYWTKVEAIGSTKVAGRNATRTIWLCTNDML